ncbi:MAG TPA: prefoldin subunit alpha [Candidatus Poseidoniaceae archaeon]|jgi:prefoldin alpha subunit|nr:prefoldin subunit alpha [Candidatus Poseidoniaceae archaeon]
MNREELKNISQMRDLNHQKIAQIEEQISKLDQVIQEHETVLRSLTQLTTVENNEGMVPIGAGVQIPIKYTNVKSTIIDIGSGIHAEKSLENTITLLETRITELKELIDSLVEEHTSTTDTIKEINKRLEEVVNLEEKQPTQENKNKEKPQKKRRRRYGGELTLDD